MNSPSEKASPCTIELRIFDKGVPVPEYSGQRSLSGYPFCLTNSSKRVLACRLLRDGGACKAKTSAPWMPEKQPGNF
jgi:hypothetical protein